MALFFFISGYFFKPKYGFSAKLTWIKHKTFKLLLPYFLLNTLFAGFTVFLKTQQIDLGQTVNLYNFWVLPFLHGHQFLLFAPAWFVIQLYIVHFIYQIIYIKDLKYYQLFVTGSLTLVAFLLVQISTSGDMNNLKRLTIRTFFALAFYSLGYLYSIYKDNLRQYLIKPETAFLAIAVYKILESVCQIITYELVWARFLTDHPILPFLSSVVAIIILLNVAHVFVKFFPNENLIYKIGRNTFFIMCFHLTVFFGVNLILCFCGLIKYENLSQGNFRWHVEQIWFLYSIPGILVPTYLSIAYHNFIKRLPHPLSRHQAAA
jgi:fucose 4-O-acetylase-like acetyltransferase